MKRLIMQSAVDDKDSCFDAKMCFDFDGKTYEYLPPEQIIARNAGLPDEEHLAPFVRYREVLAADDYDYVSVGGKHKTELDVELLNKQLDAAWRQHIISQPIADRSDGERFVKSMYELGLLWHFDDDPAEIVSFSIKSGGEMKCTFSDKEVIELRKRVDELFNLDWSPHEDVFGFALTFMTTEEVVSPSHSKD